jgi:hypothetical protein
VLLVGLGSCGAQGLSDRLRGWGFRCYRATNLRAAREVFELVRVDMVLTNAHLSDGTGVGLAASLTGMPVTVFVCVPLEDSCLWLPAIDCGRVCLGLPALRPAEFASSLDEIAGHLLPEPKLDRLDFHKAHTTCFRT